MKRSWTDDELAEEWTLLADERASLANKTGSTRLGFAALLKFLQFEGRFPRRPVEVPTAVVGYLAAQVGVPATEWSRYDWDGRAIEYHRAQIRALLGFRESTVEDAEILKAWLIEEILPEDRSADHAKAALLERMKSLRLEPPTPDRLDRLLRSAIAGHEERFCWTILNRLPLQARAGVEALLAPAERTNREGDALLLSPDSQKRPLRNT